MKTLIIEDDSTCRFLLRKMLERYGDCHTAANGRQAVAAVLREMEEGKPYNLICLDIMMPEMDGQAVLKEIRGMEEAKGIPPSGRVKIVMTTALGDIRIVFEAYKGGSDGFLLKPIVRAKLLKELARLNLIEWPPRQMVARPASVSGRTEG